MKNRIVILGGAGFIGYHLSFFLAEKYPTTRIIIADSFINSKLDSRLLELLERPNVRLIEGNLCEETFVSNLIQQNDYVLNLAAFNGTANFYNFPFSVLENSAISAILAPKYCAINGAKKYIYFGSSESYAGAIQLGLVDLPTKEDVPLVVVDPKNPRWSYGSAKTIGEIAAHAVHAQYGLSYNILRVHNIYGPRMGINHVIPDLINRFNEGNGTVYGIEETRSFLFVTDAIHMISEIMSNKSCENLTLNIGSEDEISIKDLSLLIKDLVKPELELTPLDRIPGSVVRRRPDMSLTRSFVSPALTNLSDGLKLVIKDILG
jgi:UDP-glucose 4-epimerase